MEDGSDVPGLRPAHQYVAMPRHVEDKRYVQVPHVPCHAHDHVPQLGRRVGEGFESYPDYRAGGVLQTREEDLECGCNCRVYHAHVGKGAALGAALQ